MSLTAIIMMSIALVIIWGGLLLAIKRLPKE
ncbi:MULTISPECIES: methionine/alanine import family NSS transporter small subunit [Volucribacter]|uniref:Putative methionine/alanine importer small subunit n=1 Tax=Volucribacter psittacicida TaxID=203482 RepID=A0A4R1FUE4_9PAST|nr:MULTISPECIES: methionine/alanine import family NSS transporter small subunit [Volucribacter]TCJ98966.1 putative methionine/alanine importer small subunit [Volucribacter psittacicida]